MGYGHVHGYSCATGKSPDDAFGHAPRAGQRDCTWGESRSVRQQRGRAYPDAVRAKLATWTLKYDEPMLVKRDSHSNWTDNSCITAEVLEELLPDYGWTQVPGTDEGSYSSDKIHILMTKHESFRALDVIERVYEFLGTQDGQAYRKKINEILESHRCPWRLQDGQFFKLDSDFIGAELAVGAHEALVSNNFEGAAEEYAKARQELSTGNVKDAIADACKSVESVLKVLTGEKHINSDKLLQKFMEMGFLNDLPEEVRGGVVRQVLTAVPFLRNKLGGHGQGAFVINVPVVYGELAVQLAAAVHNFLIAKHIERAPKPADVNPADDLDDQIPF